MHRVPGSMLSAPLYRTDATSPSEIHITLSRDQHQTGRLRIAGGRQDSYTNEHARAMIATESFDSK
jgi:hypothetical protein